MTSVAGRTLGTDTCSATGSLMASMAPLGQTSTITSYHSRFRIFAQAPWMTLIVTKGLGDTARAAADVQYALRWLVLEQTHESLRAQEVEHAVAEPGDEAEMVR